MVELGFDASSTVHRDGITAHELNAFPEVERVTYDGASVRAYRDRADSMGHLFAAAAEQAPDRKFLAFPERGVSLTYAEVQERVERTAAGLVDRGLDDGRVGLALSNRPAFAELLLACFRVGSVVVPLNTHLSTHELAPVLGDANADLIVTEPETVDTVRNSVDTLEDDADPALIVLDDSTARAPTSTDAEQPLRAATSTDAPLPAESDMAAILFTSGTTGRPKACRADHFHLTNGTLNNARSFAFEDGTRSLVTTPLFHVSGLVSGFLSVLPVAGSTVIRESFSPRSFLETIDSHEVNYVMGVPANYILAVEKGDPSAYDLSSLSIAAYGSAPMPSETVTEIREAFPDCALTNTYGKTETVSGLSSMCPDKYTDDRPDSVGLPTPLLEYRVVDETREALPAGDVGELAVRGGIVVSEYLGRPEATAEEFRDGWHFTGDIGTIDRDGFISLKGRDSDIIIRGGENVHTLEVEETLAAHEGVLEAGVVGFPDEVLGERVLAAVVPSPGSRVTEESLQAICEERLAAYKRPEIYRIVDELPRNPNGKVEKSALLPEPLRHGIRAGD